MGVTFHGIFYKSKFPLTKKSKKTKTMGFEGFVDMNISLDDIIKLGEKYINKKFIYIYYSTWSGEIYDTEVLIINRGNHYWYKTPKKYIPTYHIPKFILLAIKRFGFIEFAEPMGNSKYLSSFFEPFTREYIKEYESDSESEIL